VVLRKLTETSSTITLGWDTVPTAVVYRGTRKSYVTADGQQRWTQATSAARSMKFQKDEWYLVEALTVADSGRYPSPSPAPEGAVFPNATRFPSEAI